jgi:hypothetical protein
MVVSLAPGASYFRGDGWTPLPARDNVRRMPTKKKEPETISLGARHPPTWRLAHNPVQPTDVDQKHGWNGFRLFWVPPADDRWTECQCGWRPDLGAHYHHKDAKHRPIKK